MIALEREWDLKFNVRPVYPIAIRLDGWFKNANPMWLPYLVKDVMREAERWNTPFMWPRPDPIAMDLATGEVSKNQPFIHRLTRLGVAASERGRGLPFIFEISSTLYNGRIQNWHEGNHLNDAASRAGLDLASLDASIEQDPNHFESIIKGNEEAHRKSGHWGVPTFAFRGEPFFGQDRIDALLWRLEKNGLKKNSMPKPTNCA
jgi:2-hydroxychromene-2-carboxylate isomerase